MTVGDAWNYRALSNSFFTGAGVRDANARTSCDPQAGLTMDRGWARYLRPMECPAACRKPPPPLNVPRIDIGRTSRSTSTALYGRTGADDPRRFAAGCRR